MTLQVIEGPWEYGLALDWHTVSSEYAGDDAAGHPRFETERTQVGEWMFHYKYRNDDRALESILELAIPILEMKLPVPVRLVVPVPASSSGRIVTARLARGLALGLGAKYAEAVSKVRPTDAVKDVADRAERVKLLSGAFRASKLDVEGRRILMVDDLYRSGATMEAVAAALRMAGSAEVCAFAVTRTRVNR